MSYSKETHINFYYRYKNIYKNDINFDKTENDIIKIMNKNILKSIKTNMSIIEIINIIFDNFYYGNIKKKKIMKKIKYKIMSHTNRVIRHLNIILNFSEYKGRDKYSEYEKYLMFLACILHDIGKIYNDDDYHAIYSYIIAKYLLDLNKHIDIKAKNIILEIILMHGNKKQYKDEISEYTALVRDADLFDENCGFSLTEILNLMIVGCKNAEEYDYYDKKYLKKLNLNKKNYEISDDLKEYKTCDKYIRNVKLRINIAWNKELYDIERNKAVNEYENMKNQYIINLQYISDKILKYENAYKINID